MFLFLFSMVLLFLPALLNNDSVSSLFFYLPFFFSFSLLSMTLFPVPFALYINLIPPFFFIFPASRGCVSLPLFPPSFTPSFPLSPSPSHPSRVSELCVYFYSSLYYAVVLKFRPRLWKCWGRTIYESFFFFFFQTLFLKRRSEKKWGVEGWEVVRGSRGEGESGWNEKEE